jgi:hypothetical protein
MQAELGTEVSHEDIKNYLWKTLKGGQVVPGYVSKETKCFMSKTDTQNDLRYGHGVLRNPDPRFIALQEFCESRPELMSSPTIQLVKKTYEVAPDVLKEHGKASILYTSLFNVISDMDTQLDQEPIPQRRCHVWLCAVPLRIDRIQVLHSHFRCIESFGSSDSTRLGSSTRSSHRETKVYAWFIFSPRITN